MFGDFLSSAQDERFRSLQEIPGAKTLFFARNCKMSRCTFKCTGRLHNLKSRAVSFYLFDFFWARLPRDSIFFIFGNRPYDPHPPTQASPRVLWFPFSAFLILISGTLMYLFGLRTGLAKNVGIRSSRILAAVLFLSLCSASLKGLRVPARSSVWDPFYINRQKNRVLKALVKFFQSRNVEWKNSECGWVRVFCPDPWKSWAAPGHTPNLVIYFFVHNVERKFHGRGTAFGKNQGVVGPESIPKTFQ